MDNKQLEKEFDDLIFMFSTDGWKALMAELSEQMAVVNDMPNTRDLDDLRIRQGQHSVIKQLLDYEATTRSLYEQWFAEQQA